MWVEPIQNIQWPNFQKVFSFDPKLRQKYLESDIFVQILLFTLEFCNQILTLMSSTTSWILNWSERITEIAKISTKMIIIVFTQLVRKYDS